MSTVSHEEILLEIARALNASVTLETAVERVLELIGEGIGADAVSILVKEADDSTTGELSVSFARRGGAVERGAVSVDLGLSGFVFETCEPVLVDDVRNEPRYEGKLDSEFGTKTRSLIAVPIRRGGKSGGLIEALREEPRPFTASDLEFIMAVADELAVTLENAFLIEKLQQDVRERELLLGAARAVGSTLDIDEVLTNLLSTLSELVPHDAVGVYLLDEETGTLDQIQHRGYPPGTGQLLRERPGKGLTGWAAKNRTSVNVGRVKDDPRYIEARPMTQSEVVVPILRADDVIGVITVESDEADAYSDQRVELLEIFAGQVASAITNAVFYQREMERMRIEHELDLAREIQAALLPREALAMGPIEADGVNVPSSEVGGDYYDYFAASEDHVAVALGDVSGHGVSASLLISAVRTGVRLNAGPDSSMATLATELGRLLYDSTPTNQYVAAVLALIDLRDGTLTYCNCGHAPPLLIRDGARETLLGGGMILGAFPQATYQERTVELRPGDLLVFYTDGLTEMCNPQGDDFGLDRLATLIEELRDLPLDEIITEVQRSAREFRADAVRSDDVTLMLVRWRGDDEKA